MKLKSRKFWLSIVVIAYAAIMGIRALSVENTATTLVCIAAAAVAGIAYVIAEALVDAEGTTEDDGEAEG